MKLIYLDESGHAYNWQKDCQKQPFYVLSAIACDISEYSKKCDCQRKELKKFKKEETNDPEHGKGYETKSKEIFTNQGWWKNHSEERTEFINCMLNFAEKAWVVIIDKAKLSEQYRDPIDPFELSLTFMFERMESYLKENNDYAICIYDQTFRKDEKVHNKTSEFLNNGTMFKTINRILECHLGNSKNSIGLQIADFYATGVYQHYKNGKPDKNTWWNILETHLYKSKNGKLKGYGLKEFP